MSITLNYNSWLWGINPVPSGKRMELFSGRVNRKALLFPADSQQIRKKIYLQEK